MFPSGWVLLVVGQVLCWLCNSTAIMLQQHHAVCWKAGDLRGRQQTSLSPCAHIAHKKGFMRLEGFMLKEALSEERANASCRWMMWLCSGLVSYGM